ncbi:universal stress protein [Amycolatopsis sp. FU40]|uniref:universal stress protein n=1 Tax=Amycolatopsis sp. FU40 TaxID=2914159 RepID=UPI001F323E5F|nr:universal stress protein [Amycolatopsis sp. FU40]UKD57420.1 universal stress protein [Amycolatopsis sp. FU40]
MNTDPVLVGVDGSESAAAAARWAAREAVLRHVPLTVLAAFGFADGSFVGERYPPVEWLEVKEAEAEELLQAVRDDLAEVEPRVRIAVETSPAGPEVALREASAKARMLVLGEPTGTLSGLLAGSPDIDLVAHAHCPVVVVRGTIRPREPVVVGVDGSPLSEAAIGCAFEEAAVRGVPLVAVHAWLDADRSRLFGDRDFPFEAREAEHRLLAQRISGYSALYPDVRVERIVEQDRPRDRLIEWSSRASLVVLGSRGRGGFTGMVLGSTSHALLHHAECPVLVVRAGTTAAGDR